MPGSRVVVLRLSSCVLVAAACGDDPVGVPDAPRVIDAAPPPIDAVDDACAPPTGPGTDHVNALAADELWTEADSPHRISTQVGVPAGVTLRLAPCAVVELGPDAALTVSGSLLAEGEPTRRVQIRAASSGQPWRWIDVSGGALSLTHTRIEGGGAPGAGGGVTARAMVRVRGDGNPLGQALVSVDEVDLVGSASTGMILASAARFSPGGGALRITGSALAPLVLDPSAVGVVPTGTYAGNGLDAIVVPRVAFGVSGQVLAVSMQPRGVPYQMGTSEDPNPVQQVGVGTAGTAILAIEPGTTLAMLPGYRLDVDAAAGGSLVAIGTAAAPITMTSAATTPAAGDWVGLVFRGVPNAGTAIDHAVIEHAGAPGTSSTGFSCGTPPAGVDSSRTMGAIVITSTVPGVAPTAFVTNTTIRTSASNGVDRGYRADADIDFLASNTFSGIRYCTQTEPRDAGNGCPDPVPCPMAP